VPPSPRPPRLLCALALLALAACATPPARQPAATDALPRWRAAFESFTARDTHDDLFETESADTPSPALPPETFARLENSLAPFALLPGETLRLPRLHGPETPFPDHQPLRRLASLRTNLARAALAAGDRPRALALVETNLAQARATLREQSGLIPLIHAQGVWQCALDGVHALAADPGLAPDEARALLRDLEADAGLASLALTRALRGEFEDVYRVVVERIPATDDPDLLLSAVSMLGMDTPVPLAPGEIGLGLTEHPLLDVPATLAAYEADLAPYLAALARETRLPRGLYARTTAVTLAAHRNELGAFFTYACGELPPGLPEHARARADLLATTNPGGKLLAVLLTPAWEPLIASALRREAQRSALCGLLAWRIHGAPADWDTLVAAGVLAAPPADPFADPAAPLRCELRDRPRVWSVHLDSRDDGGVPVEGNVGQPDDLVWLLHPVPIAPAASE